jgi:hypothetical protein
LDEVESDINDLLDETKDISTEDSTYLTNHKKSIAGIKSDSEIIIACRKQISELLEYLTDETVEEVDDESELKG